LKLLLDTHVWLWGLLEPHRIRRPVSRLLGQPGTRLWLSPVSLWEIVILVEKGRVRLDKSLDEMVEAALGSERIEIAAVSAAVALEMARVPLKHADPADRLLAATARVYDLTLVTADARLLAAPGLRCLKA
jgi:PIN domain nuclease of toxin-antitoxin system